MSNKKQRNKNIDTFLKESADFQRALGKEPQFESFEEFNRFMESDEAFKL